MPAFLDVLRTSDETLRLIVIVFCLILAFVQWHEARRQYGALASLLYIIACCAIIIAFRR